MQLSSGNNYIRSINFLQECLSQARTKKKFLTYNSLFMLFLAYAWNIAYACINSIQYHFLLNYKGTNWLFLLIKNLLKWKEWEWTHFHMKYSLLWRMVILVTYITIYKKYYIFAHTTYFILHYICNFHYIYNTFYITLIELK